LTVVQGVVPQLYEKTGNLVEPLGLESDDELRARVRQAARFAGSLPVK
jgi:hypothetical protein